MCGSSTVRVSDGSAGGRSWRHPCRPTRGEGLLALTVELAEEIVTPPDIAPIHGTHLGQERPRVLVDVPREKLVDPPVDPSLAPVQEADPVRERGERRPLVGEAPRASRRSSAEPGETPDQPRTGPGSVIADPPEESPHLGRRGVFDEGGRLPGQWLVDHDGRPSDDPAVLFGPRPGALLPLGGPDLGHKGFALALIVEALTSGLAGHGRADEPKRWGASVFLQLIDPERFAGRDAFLRESTRLAESCRVTPVAAGRPAVRLPGDEALRRRERQLRDGVTLHAGTLPALRPWAERYGVAVPA